MIAEAGSARASSELARHLKDEAIQRLEGMAFFGIFHQLQPMNLRLLRKEHPAFVFLKPTTISAPKNPLLTHIPQMQLTLALSAFEGVDW